MTLPQIPTAWYVTTSIVALGAILYPFILAMIAQRRLHVSWKYFGFGALIFFLFQIITRVPAVTVLGQVLKPELQASQTAQWIWLGALALTAGLFEEVGRYVGYRWLMGKEEKTWNKAIMYGIGHGGIESILLVGGVNLLAVINVATVSAIGLSALPEASRATVQHQFATLAAQPGWLPLLGLWERLWTLPVHVALSVVVLQVFRRGGLRWLWLAVGAHALFDFVTIALVQILGSGTGTSLLVEGVVALGGIVALWAIFRLRDVSAITGPTHNQRQRPN
jgi:uncharacterized membrane protein YhfC